MANSFALPRGGDTAPEWMLPCSLGNPSQQRPTHTLPAVQLSPPHPHLLMDARRLPPGCGWLLDHREGKKFLPLPCTPARAGPSRASCPQL